MAKQQAVTVVAVGDVIVNRPDDPTFSWRLAAPVLKKADIAFGNCETNYSEKGVINPVERGGVISHPKNIAGLTYAGFAAMGFAQNHHLGFGYPAFLDTIDRLHEAGILTAGVGKDLDEARKPAILERKGVKVAFLQYCCGYPIGYDAGFNKPGGAPIKIYTVYDMVEHEMPGSVPDIHTFPDYKDLAAMQEDIRKARKQADVVLMSVHWGIHFLPAVIAEYQGVLGRAAIDAGAAAVIGHHQHILKGIEMYRGKPIFHGLGNFVMDVHLSKDHMKKPGINRMVSRYGEFGVGPREETPTYPFHEQSRNTMIAKCTIADGKVTYSFIPCYINGKGQPEPLKASNKLFKNVKDYVENISRQVGFDTKFTIEGSEVKLS